MAITDYSHFFNSFGFKLANVVGIATIDSDPSISGYDMPIGSLVLRSDAPGIYQKTTAPITGWIKIENSINPEIISTGNDNNQTATSYDLALSDAENTTIYMNNSSNNTVNILANSSVAFPIGTKINIISEGSGATAIQAAAGVTINGVVGGNATINNQYQGTTLAKRSTDVWTASGDIT